MDDYFRTGLEVLLSRSMKTCVLCRTRVGKKKDGLAKVTRTSTHWNCVPISYVKDLKQFSF